jgi:predicted SAM-dependent methyltransferase
VLEHLADPELGVRQLAGLLASSGRVVIEVPNNECLTLADAGVSWPWLDVPRHQTFFTLASLSRMLGDAGFVIESAEFLGFARQFQSDWLAREKHIRDVLNLDSEAAKSDGVLLLIRRFARSLLASARKKYDSLRIVARAH